MQTPDYARQLLLSFGNSEEAVARKLIARSERQVVLDRPDRPELNVVIGEAALSRTVGNDAVMREQIATLRARAGETDVNLYLLPFAAGAHLENAERMTVSRDHPDEVERYLELFVNLKELSERFGDFITMLDKVTEGRFGES